MSFYDLDGKWEWDEPREPRNRYFTCYPAGRGEPHISCRGERFVCEHGVVGARCQCGCSNDFECPKCNGDEVQCEMCGEWVDKDEIIDEIYCSEKCQKEDQ